MEERDEADANEKKGDFRSSKLKAEPLALYLTVTLSGRHRPTDLVICKLGFEKRRWRNRRRRYQSRRKKRLDQSHVAAYISTDGFEVRLTAWFSMRAKMTLSIWVRVALAVVWLMRFLLAR